MEMTLHTQTSLLLSGRRGCSFLQDIISPVPQTALKKDRACQEKGLKVRQVGHRSLPYKLSWKPKFKLQFSLPGLWKLRIPRRKHWTSGGWNTLQIISKRVGYRLNNSGWRPSNSSQRNTGCSAETYNPQGPHSKVEGNTLGTIWILMFILFCRSHLCILYIFFILPCDKRGLN